MPPSPPVASPATEPPIALTPPLQIWRDVDDLIVVAGEIDSSTCGPLRDAIKRSQLTRPAAPVLLDMREVDFIDSSGLGVLIEAYNVAGRLSIVNPSYPVERLLRLTGQYDRFVACATALGA